MNHPPELYESPNEIPRSEDRRRKGPIIPTPTHDEIKLRTMSMVYDFWKRSDHPGVYFVRLKAGWLFQGDDLILTSKIGKNFRKMLFLSAIDTTR